MYFIICIDALIILYSLSCDSISYIYIGSLHPRNHQTLNIFRLWGGGLKSASRGRCLWFFLFSLPASPVGRFADFCGLRFAQPAGMHGNQTLNSLRGLQYQKIKKSDSPSDRVHRSRTMHTASRHGLIGLWIKPPIAQSAPIGANG